MDRAPLWLIGVLLFAALFVAREAGFWLRWRRRDGQARTSSDDEGHVLSVSLGLLALLIGFTFAMALARHDQQRAFVLQEANAIGSAYGYAALLNEPDRSDVRARLRAYVDARMRYADGSPRADTADTAYRETATLQRELAEHVAAAVRPERQTSLATALVGNLNTMFDAAAARKAAIEARVPARVIEVLILFAFIAQGILGYVLGDPERRQRVLGVVLSGLLTMALVLVIDLDRPWSGAVQVSQQPMLDLRENLRTAQEETAVAH